MPHISNLNSVSIKNYGAENETLAVLRELRKLGIIKTVSKPKPKAKPLMIEDIKQPSDMVSSVKTLDKFPLRLATAGMTDLQIEDINRRNAANIAVLTGELKQQRLQDIEAQQGQRLSDISSLSSIMNPVLERFRGSTFPAQQSGGEPLDPFASSRSGAPIRLGFTDSDIEEGRFTGGINEGAPVVVTEKPTETFSVEGEQEEQEATIEPRIQTQEKIRGSKKNPSNPLRKGVTDSYELPPIPVYRGTTTPDMLAYYRTFMNRTNNEINPNNLNSKQRMFDEMNSIVDELALTL